MQALTTMLDLTLVKDGQDFVQSFGVAAQVEEGFVQVVDVTADGATVDLSNFTTVEQIVVRNRDQLTLCHAEYTYVQAELDPYLLSEVRGLEFDNTTTPPRIRHPGSNVDFVADGFRAGMYVRVVSPSANAGVYLISRVDGTTILELPDNVTLTTTAVADATLHQHVRNRAPIGPGEFHVVAGSGLYLPDQLVLRTRHLQPQVTCEVWVFGT